jgi:phage terminase large subunit-like protein
MTWRKEAETRIAKMDADTLERRDLCLADLRVFAKTINPQYAYGDIHMDIYKWMMDYSLFGQGETLTANKLVMLPRAHLKSHMVATWCAWIVTRHPEVTILYLSATSELAETQLYAIKNIFESDAYRHFFPEYINPQEGKREMWNNRKISLDHTERSKAGIRDATIATAGLTTNTTGWHADIIIPDDIVVPENAYTEDGRSLVSKKASQLTSIRNAGGFTMACGTRYHPADIYDTWRHQEYEVFDDNDEFVGKELIWDIVEHAVEKDDVFIWPRTTKNGKMFGFNKNVLSRIRGEYDDIVQFFAQYYNNPNAPGSNRINRDRFQYIDEKSVRYSNGQWTVQNKPVNVYAAMDFAYTTNKKSDYTAIVVIGMDGDGFIYVLDMDRFKTDKIKDMFDHLMVMHEKWTFRKLRAEVTAAQSMIVGDFKDLIRKEGMSLSIDENKPSRHEGTKEERIASILEPRYDNLTMYHTKGGLTSALEEELILARPKHDDLKDSLASVVQIAKAPRRMRDGQIKKSNIIYNKRFGGINFGG